MHYLCLHIDYLNHTLLVDLAHKDTTKTERKNHGNNRKHINYAQWQEGLTSSFPSSRARFTTSPSFASFAWISQGFCAHDMESGLRPKSFLPAGGLDEYGFTVYLLLSSDSLGNKSHQARDCLMHIWDTNSWPYMFVSMSANLAVSCTSLSECKNANNDSSYSYWFLPWSHSKPGMRRKKWRTMCTSLILCCF